MRLYRAEAPERPVSDWIEQGARERGITEARGRWFTADRDALDWYVKDVGPGARIFAVDISHQDIERYRVSNSAEIIAGRSIKSFSRDPENEFFLPRDIAGQRRQIDMKQQDRTDSQRQMQQHIAYTVQRGQQIRAEQEGQKERTPERTEPVVVSISGVKAKAKDDPEQRQDRER